MASSGIIDGSWTGGRDGYSVHYGIRVVWNITRQYYSAGSGYSDLHVSLQVYRDSAPYTAYNPDALCARYVDSGETIYWRQAIAFANYPVATWTELGSFDYTIKHNDDGTRTSYIYFEVVMGSDTSAGTGAVGGNAILDAIIVDPTIALSVDQKVSATRGGSNGSAVLAAETSGGGADYSFEISCNGQSSSTSPLNLSGLKNNTIYSYSGSIENTLGRTAEASGTFYLEPVAPALTARVGSVGSDSAELVLTPVFDTKRRLAIYEVQYGPSLSYGQSASSGSLTGLTPETVYYFRARVTDANNGGASNAALTSEWVTGTFTTSPDQARTRIKTASGWVYGRVFSKENGSWLRGKRVYRKTNGTWKEGT